MSTHLLRLHGGTADRPPLLAPVRALGALERRKSRRRPQTAAGSSTSGAADARGGPPEEKPVYWVGDERETTHGDW